MFRGIYFPQMSRGDWGFKMKMTTEDKKDEPHKDDYNLLRKYENRERDYLVNSIPGSIFKVELDNSHPLAFGYGDSYYTLYAHLSEIAVAVGQDVTAGQTIGRSGDTGSLKGAVLHFEVRRGGTALNPEDWLR